MQKEFLNPDGVAKPLSNYAQVVRVETAEAITLYVSGQGPVDARGAVVGVGDMGRQAEQVYANIRALVEACGGAMADVVKLTVFLMDMSQRPAVGAARDRFFPHDAPASTAVEISKLAVDDWLLEIDAIAVIART